MRLDRATQDVQSINKTTIRSLVPSIEEVLTSDPDQFVSQYPDIAAVNLACARGLPACNESEFPQYMSLIDEMAEAVRKMTEKRWRIFKAKSQEFNNSENVYRLYTLENVLRSLFFIKYDPMVSHITDRGNSNRPWHAKDSTETFINGLLSKKRTGTCSTLPVLSIAVGRRLGYPLYWILVPNHTLYRWDDGKEIFNLQPSEVGGEVKSDEYFHTWPMKWEPEHFEITKRTNVWLHSMTPRQEISKMLCNRAIMLHRIGQYKDAMRSVEAASRYNPKNPACIDISYMIAFEQGPEETPALSEPVEQIYGGNASTLTGPILGVPTGSTIVWPGQKAFNPKPNRTKRPSTALLRAELVTRINEINQKRMTSLTSSTNRQPDFAEQQELNSLYERLSELNAESIGD